jgi:hypothetical protein
MPFGSPQRPRANRWPKEGRERSMREARLPSRSPTAPKTERFEAGALPMASRNSFRHPCVCRRSGFSRNLCVIENRRSGVVEAASIATISSSKTKVRGESPSYRNQLFVGAAFAATLASSRTGGSGRRITALPLRGRIEGNGPWWLGLDRRAQREGRGWPLLLPDRSRI